MSSLLPIDMDPMPTKTEVTEEDCIRIAKEMIMMRRMEIESDPLYVMRKIRGFLHLYDGEVRICYKFKLIMMKNTNSIVNPRFYPANLLFTTHI